MVALLWQPALAAAAGDGKLRIIAFCAHPDDCELHAAGTAAKWAAAGHHVKFVSVTNGDIGHFAMAGGPLANRRRDEVEKAGKILGVTAQVLDIHDGELEPTLENRRTITRLIREWKADLVFSHRTNDYHPDHRAVGQLVMDSAFMVTVPFFCPDTPHLTRNPVFMHFEDWFSRPMPFRADVVVSFDDVLLKAIEAIGQLESQKLEGGAGGSPGRIPKDTAGWVAARKAMRERYTSEYASAANQYRKQLVERYGQKGETAKSAEAFEISEYGRHPSTAELKTLFPF